ncbi:MAG: TonB-dependent receptor, partial [Chitinophagaceae bacterium]|nr:TonB-dependent receptor [Chitinophagaceae bacterium]
MRKAILLCSLFALLGGFLQAQQTKVTGKVTDANGNALEGVSVSIKGKSAGAVTNSVGEFSIAATTGQTLVFSSVGLVSKELAVTGNALQVKMEASNATLSEVVVVGYGQQRKATLTGSVVTLKQEDLTKRQVATASNLLQGLAPGVTVQQQSGRPGADGASIRIRGLGSIYAGQSPLIMVDGVVSGFDMIDPNAIESITILKDAASTAIYGARAANGVVLVKTKRAKGKGVQVSYNAFLTKQDATAIPERTTAVEHMELSNLAEQNRTGNPNAFLFTQALIDKYKSTPANNLDVIDTDWLKLLLSNTGLMQNHNVTINSAGDNTNIFASVTYLNQQGLIPNNSHQRYDIRFNPDFKLNEKLSINGVLNINSAKTIAPSTGSPEFIIRQAIGLPAVGGGIYGPGMYGTAGQTNNRNPLAMAEAAGTSVSKNNSMLTKVGFNYKPVNNLEIEGYWAREFWTPNGKTFVKNVDIYVPNLVTLGYDKVGVWPGTTSLGESYSTNVRTTYLAQATWSKRFGANAIKLLGGAQTEEFTYSGISASRTGFLNPNQPYLSLGSGNLNNGGSAYETALAGFYARLNYNYDDKYFLEVNGRYDGSSRFSQVLKKQWGFFPSASAGWIFSKEKFFSGLSNIITFGKLRGSWGVLGNQALPEIYPFAVNFGTSTYSNPINGTNTYINNINTLGYALLDAPNPSITWEQSEQANIAVDLTIKNNLTFTAEIYRRKVDQMLLSRPIPNYVGLNAPFVNAGSMENRGWELSANYKKALSSKVKLDVTAMLSDVRNKVLTLPGVPFLDGGSIRTAPQQALWSYFGYQAIGYFADSNDVKNSPVQFGTAWSSSPTVGSKPGDVKYADISGPDGKPDGKVDSYDRTFIGNNFPRYEYSLNLNLSIGNLDISIFGQGVGMRNNYYSGTGAVPFASSDFAASLLKMHKDYWTPSNPNARFPRLLPSGSGGNNYVASSQWIRDASYFRLKNVNIAYRFPASWFKKTGMPLTGAKIYVSGQNLLTFTKAWDGFDPEINNANAEFYPLMRTMTVGVNINF